jgi:hypothetical protein
MTSLLKEGNLSERTARNEKEKRGISWKKVEAYFDNKWRVRNCIGK